MEIKVQEKFLKTTPRKIRFVADQFKGSQAKKTADSLTFVNRAAAKELQSAIRSALAVVKEKALNEEDFRIINIRCDQGPRLKRRIMKSRGQSSMIQKRMSHLTLVISDEQGVNPKSEIRSTKQIKETNNKQNAVSKISKV